MKVIQTQESVYCSHLCFKLQHYQTFPRISMQSLLFPSSGFIYTFIYIASMKWYLSLTTSDVISIALNSWHSLSSNHQRLFWKRIQTQLQKLEKSPQNIYYRGPDGKPFAKWKRVFFRGLFNCVSLYLIIYFKFWKQNATEGLDFTTELFHIIISIINKFTLFFLKQCQMLVSILIISTSFYRFSLFPSSSSTLHLKDQNVP